MKRFLFATILSLAATSLVAQGTTSTLLADTVTVTGTGRAMVTPDRFSFNVGVQTVAATVDEAVSENNRRVAAVIAALKKAGAQDKDIQTSQFSIYPQQDYQQGKLPRIVGYQVSNNVTVRSEKVGDAGRLLGIAVGAGVNQSSGINFEVSDPTRGRDEGLRKAFDDARAKAALLAQAAGRTLGQALAISEGMQHQIIPPPIATQRQMAMAEGRVAGNVPVESGSEEVGYAVTVTFALR
jgi:uncharacterized protein YggE